MDLKLTASRDIKQKWKKQVHELIEHYNERGGTKV